MMPAPRTARSVRLGTSLARARHRASRAVQPDICSPLARPVIFSNQTSQDHASGGNTETASWSWRSCSASTIAPRSSRRSAATRQVVCPRDNRPGSRRVNHLCSHRVSLREGHPHSLQVDLPLCVNLVTSLSTAPMACIPVTYAAALLVNQGSSTRNLEVLARWCVAPALKANIRTNLEVQSARQPLLGRLLQGQDQPALRSVHSLLILLREVMWHVRLALLVGSLPAKVQLGSWTACPRSGTSSRAALQQCC